jgi:uncharacterized protein (DUF924 family)
VDDPEDVLRFWFPLLAPGDPAAMPRQLEWWFGGGADADINRKFRPLLEHAASGILDGWAEDPRSRLALIIVLDQFSRTIYRGDARAYALDSKARSLTRSGIDRGHYAALDSPWEKTFFFLPLGRQPHRNAALGRISTPEELEYLASAVPVHQRPLPPQEA